MVEQGCDCQHVADHLDLCVAERGVRMENEESILGCFPFGHRAKPGGEGRRLGRVGRKLVEAVASQPATLMLPEGAFERFVDELVQRSFNGGALLADVGPVA